MNRSKSLCLIAILGLTLIAASGLTAKEPAAFDFRLRYRDEVAPDTDRWHVLTRSESWDPRQTAVIVCDMWDYHYCRNATRRGAEMAPRMNDFVAAARSAGATIIHAPSGCMEFYKDHPARRRAVDTPRAMNIPASMSTWCEVIAAENFDKYPLDQSDGGVDESPEEHAAWHKELAALGRNPAEPIQAQTDLISIVDNDFISDSGEEVWSILEDRGIKNVLLVGVHTNMCILGRPFGLRNLVQNGKNAVLVRDLTDTMYNPAKRPFVSHFTGNDLIVGYIEKYVCPTITSDQLLGGKPHRFANDTRPRLLMITAEDEYKTEETLPVFAAEHLGKDYSVEVVYGDADERNNLPGIELVEDADVVLVSVRRRVLPEAQLALVRKHVESGKPLVGIRTASHAFSNRNGEVPAGHAAWPEFDRDILGGNYRGHHGNGIESKISVAPGAENHPVLNGVDVDALVGRGSLYKAGPVSSTATPLLIGTIPDEDAEPVAWVNVPSTGGRVFYTSLGHVDDFKQEAFCRLLRNGVDWAAER